MGGETIVEYTDEVVAKIKEGASPNEALQEISGEEDQERKPVGKPSVSEKAARADGWKPLEDFDGDPDTWVDHPEFNRRGELMTRIKGQTKALKSNEKRIKELEESIKFLGEHNKKIHAVEFERAKKLLKEKKIEAMEENDHEAIIEIDEKMDELVKEAKAVKDKQIVKEEKKAPEEGKVPQPIADWVALPENAWYKEDDILQAAADGLATTYAQQHFDPSLQPEDQDWDGLIEHVEKRMKKRFPNEIKEIVEADDEDLVEDDDDDEEEPTKVETKKKQRRQRVADTNTPRKRARSTTKLTKADLNDDELKTYHEWVEKQQIMTADEYLSQLESVKVVS